MRVLDIDKYKISFPFFDFNNFNEIEKKYYIYHIPRFALLLSIINDLISKLKERDRKVQSGINILDMGPHFLTEIIRNETDAKVDQLGWRYDFITKPRDEESHYEFNLNDCIMRDKWPQMAHYDIVVACEILEHVYTSFDFILPFLNSIVKDNGYLLIGTPNAVSLKRRLVMLAGKNPFDRITTTIYNPNHFREYTRDEIVEIVSAYGFNLLYFNCMSNYNYINHGIIGNANKLLSKILPLSLRDNMTFVFQKVSNILWLLTSQ